ncbi:MAG TPA: hypothetical protein VKA68_02315 [bacterium]|nr:hypothetical protein [bacterium]
MAYYLVRATLKPERADILREQLEKGTIRNLQPFGRALTYSLEHARWNPETGEAVWEEEDYCSPPLAQERSSVLDTYFEDIRIHPVSPGEGWEHIKQYPSLWRVLTE